MLWVAMQTVASLKAYIQLRGSSVFRQSLCLRAKRGKATVILSPGDLAHCLQYTVFSVAGWPVAGDTVARVRWAKDGSLFFQLDFLFRKAVVLQEKYLASHAAYKWQVVWLEQNAPNTSQVYSKLFVLNEGALDVLGAPFGHFFTSALVIYSVDLRFVSPCIIVQFK